MYHCLKIVFVKNVRKQNDNTQLMSPVHVNSQCPRFQGVMVLKYVKQKDNFHHYMHLYV